MTDAQRYFRGARDMIRRARNTDNLFEARRCRFLAEWFLEYRRKLISRAVPTNDSQRKELEHERR